jgi:serine acetyltransferase
VTTPQRRCADWQHQRLAALRRDLDADIRRYLTKSAENLALGQSRKRRLSALLTPELQCLLLHRLAHWLHCNGWRRLATGTARLNTALYKVHLPPHSCIGPGLRLSHPAGVVFHGCAGSGLTLFGMAVCCADTPQLDGALDRAPQLGDDVTLGAHAVVIGPVQVATGTQVGPFVRLADDVPPGMRVVARAMRQRVAPATPGHTSSS